AGREGVAIALPKVTRGGVGGRRFLLRFATLAAAFYFVSLAPAFDRRVTVPVLRGEAAATGLVLRGLGQHPEVKGVTIASSSFAMEVRRGCDAIEPVALVVLAIAASPARWRTKLGGALAATAILAALNLTRLVTLFFVGLHFPRAFNVMHLDVWQALFVLV